MYGSPLAKPALPPLDATTPYIVMCGGRPWLSSIGLAAVMGHPHTALLSTIEALDIAPDFRADNFRASRHGNGVRAPGLWISPQGFDLLLLTFPRDKQSAWRAVLQQAFRHVESRGPVELAEPTAPVPTAPPGWGLDWFMGLFRNGKNGRPACKA
jgi:hypothetical protein